jgi:DNA-binding XRE family transcriptional regulator
MRNDLGRVLYRRNLREQDLARRAGLTESHLNRIKNGRVMPSVETALRICRALELPVESVFHLDDARARTGGARPLPPASTARHPRRPLPDASSTDSGSGPTRHGRR